MSRAPADWFGEPISWGGVHLNDQGDGYEVTISIKLTEAGVNTGRKVTVDLSPDAARKMAAHLVKAADLSDHYSTKMAERGRAERKA